MAKQLQSVLVEKYQGIIKVWVDNPHRWIKEIESIAGVDFIVSFSVSSFLHIHPDPRYDMEEIAQEIETLLLAEVPDIFKD